jgi:hypothetical protein
MSVGSEQVRQVTIEHAPAVRIAPFDSTPRRLPGVAIAEHTLQSAPRIPLVLSKAWHREIATDADAPPTDESNAASVSLLALALAGEWALRRRAGRHRNRLTSSWPTKARPFSQSCRRDTV